MVEVTTAKHFVPEYEEIYDLLGRDTKRLAYVFSVFIKKLLKKHYTVTYPLDMIVVPRYPFTKRPMISWMHLETKDPHDHEVVQLKKYCGLMGNLINVGFLLKGYVLIDIDLYNEEYSRLAHVKTAEGYHIIFKLKGAEGLKIKSKDTTSFKKLFKVSGGQIEIMSGPFYLGSHPLQTRYIEVVEGKINVRSYQCLSKEAYTAFKVADMSLLEVEPNYVVETLKEVLSIVGAEKQLENVEITPVEKVDISEVMVEDVSTKSTRFNKEVRPVFADLTFKEFKELASKASPFLPTCFKVALLGSPIKGTRWYHLRLLASILPGLCYITEDGLSEIAKDFHERCSVKPSEFREWLYSLKYYTGRLEKLVVPSKYGPPIEAWDTFAGLGYCQECPLKDKCLKTSPGKRKLLLLTYIAEVISRYVD